MRNNVKYSIGDRVMVYTHNRLVRDTTVAKVSPQGNLVTLEGGSKYRADGTSDGSYYMRHWDDSIAQRLIDGEEKRRLSHHLREIDYAGLSLSALQQLAAIVAEDRLDQQRKAEVL